MCSIFGFVNNSSKADLSIEPDFIRLAQRRGRDSWGLRDSEGKAIKVVGSEVGSDAFVSDGNWAIGNTRAEPTTEWVRAKTEDDVQPFTAGSFTVAHNGTIANDKELAAKYSVTADLASSVDTALWVEALAASGADTPDEVLDFLTTQTIGSYAMAIGHRDGWSMLVCNYRPIWTRLDTVSRVVTFTSIAPRERGYLDRLGDPWTMLDPYSALISYPWGRLEHRSLRPAMANPRSLVVCSGGLDSTVAATLAAQAGPTDLLHITYGCRAQQREIEAVTAIAERLGCGLRMLDLTDVFTAIGNSRLTGSWQGAAEGEAGAEYAIEWVPARNLILLAVATGIAEGHGYDRLVLGNNIEEAGAYPDNEQEFIGRLNDLLPFAVADGKRVVVDEPVGALTKREIVKLGLDAGAPLDLTWSCYDGGEHHCGHCGPCYMRRVAFQMLGQPDPIVYATTPTSLSPTQAH